MHSLCRLCRCRWWTPSPPHRRRRTVATTPARWRLPRAREKDGATLTFKDVTYTVSTSKGPLEILKGVSGMLQAGSLTAIMGPSGCGKSTLLDILADSKATGTVAADIRLNGAPRPSNYRSIAAYVMQSDATHPALTVRETLNFAAQMRMQADARRADRARDGDAGGRQPPPLRRHVHRRRRPRRPERRPAPARHRRHRADQSAAAPLPRRADERARRVRRAARRLVAPQVWRPRADRRVHHPPAARRHLPPLRQPPADGGRRDHVQRGAIADIYPYFGGVGVPCDPSVNPADFIVDLTHSPEEGEEEEDEPTAAPTPTPTPTPPPTPPTPPSPPPPTRRRLRRGELVTLYHEGDKYKKLLEAIDTYNARAAGSAGFGEPARRRQWGAPPPPERLQPFTRARRGARWASSSVACM